MLGSDPFSLVTVLSSVIGSLPRCQTASSTLRMRATPRGACRVTTGISADATTGSFWAVRSLFDLPATWVRTASVAARALIDARRAPSIHGEMKVVKGWVRGGRACRPDQDPRRFGCGATRNCDGRSYREGPYASKPAEKFPEIFGGVFRGGSRPLWILGGP